METTSIWKSTSLGLAKDLVVDPRDMGKLAEKYVALLVEKKILYPVLYRGPIGSQPPRAVPMATSVGEHCEGCGKLNHKRTDCTSGHDPKHLDFNVDGKWIGCATYKTIKAWLISNDRADEHPIQVEQEAVNNYRSVSVYSTECVVKRSLRQE